MLANVIMAIFFILAYFGLYCLLDVIDLRFQKKLKNGEGLVMAVLVRNAEDTVEYSIRKIRESGVSGLMNIDKFIIIDMNSNDETPEILWKISEKYDDMEIFEYEDREKLFDSFEYLNAHEKQGELIGKL